MRFEGYCATVEVLHRTSKWGEVRRLACPLRRFPFAAPPNCGLKGGTQYQRGRDRRSRRVQRVDGPAARRLWPADAGRLYRRVAEKRFLKWMGPWGPRVRKFDGAFSPEGCGLPVGAQRTHFALCELDL